MHWEREFFSAFSPLLNKHYNIDSLSIYAFNGEMLLGLWPKILKTHSPTVEMKAKQWSESEGWKKGEVTILSMKNLSSKWRKSVQLPW